MAWPGRRAAGRAPASSRSSPSFPDTTPYDAIMRNAVVPHLHHCFLGFVLGYKGVSLLGRLSGALARGSCRGAGLLHLQAGVPDDPHHGQTNPRQLLHGHLLVKQQEAA